MWSVPAGKITSPTPSLVDALDFSPEMLARLRKQRIGDGPQEVAMPAWLGIGTR